MIEFLKLSPNIGTTSISYVVAPVLGSAISGPMHKIIDDISKIPAVFPSLEVKSSTFPPTFNSANIAKVAKPISAKKYEKNEICQSLALVNPKYGGKIIFPAPKYMEKIAKPKIKLSL